jgi:hypothetical protein
MEWDTLKSNTTVSVAIVDTEHIIADGDPVTEIPLVATGNPLVVSTINNDKKKYGIFAKQAELEFYCSNSVNAYTFAGAKDNRWKVVVSGSNALGGGQEIFLGFLVTTELQRPFLDGKQVIKLTASDNIGLLKERKLRTLAGAVPTGKNRIADYLTWCLNATGQSLELFVAHNIYHGTGDTLIDYANFSNASSTIFFPSSFYPQFFEGQYLTVNSSGANNGTIFKVVTNNGGANIQVTPAPVHESGIVNFTLQDAATGHIYDKQRLANVRIVILYWKKYWIKIVFWFNTMAGGG